MLVLYDANCALCRSLAAFMAKRAPADLRFQAWDDFIAARPGLAEAGAPADLGLWLDDGPLLAGDAAWETLLRVHPDLAQLNWLAQKLGLSPQASRILRQLGSSARRFCWHCPRPRSARHHKP